MSEIWIDPAELDTLAGVISQQVRRAEDAVAGGLGLDGLDLPAHLGWMREAAAEMAQEALVASVLNLLSAIDLGARAGLIRTDQAVAPDVATPGEVQGGGGFVLSGPLQLDPASAAAMAAGSPAGPGFALNLIQAPDGTVFSGTGFTPGLNGLLSLHAATHDLRDLPYLAGRNETFDPTTGQNELDPEKIHLNKVDENEAIEQQRLRRLDDH